MVGTHQGRRRIVGECFFRINFRWWFSRLLNLLSLLLLNKHDRLFLLLLQHQGHNCFVWADDIIKLVTEWRFRIGHIYMLWVFVRNARRDAKRFLFQIIYLLFKNKRAALLPGRRVIRRFPSDDYCMMRSITVSWMCSGEFLASTSMQVIWDCSNAL